MFDAIAKNTWNQWDPSVNPALSWQNWDPTRAPIGPAQNSQGGDTVAPNFNLDQNWLSSLGFTGSPTVDLGNNTDSGNQGQTATSPELQKWLQDNGYNLQLAQSDAAHGSKNLGRLVDSSGNQVGQGQQWGQVSDDPFGVGALLGTGFAGAAASGAFAGSGAFGTGATDAGGAVGADGSVAYTPYNGPGSEGFQVAGDNAVAPEGWGSTAADGSDAHLGSIGAGDLGNMGGAAAVLPTAASSAGGGSGFNLGSTLGDAQSWMKANPGLTNIGGGLLNGLIGAYSSNRALNSQQNATNQANALLKPYNDTGVAALGHLNGLMQDPSSITSDPGYQFGLSQGTQGIDRSAASKGGLYSGATLKALDRYGQDYGGTKLNDAYNRYSGVAQLGATGTNGMANNLTNLGNAGAGAALYQGNVAQNGVNNALGQFNFSNGGYGGQNPFNQSTYADPSRKTFGG